MSPNGNKNTDPLVIVSISHDYILQLVFRKFNMHVITATELKYFYLPIYSIWASKIYSIWASQVCLLEFNEYNYIGICQVYSCYMLHVTATCSFDSDV